MNTVISLKSARGVISTKQQAVTVKVANIYKLSDSTTPYQNLSIHDRLLAVAPPAPPRGRCSRSRTARLAPLRRQAADLRADLAQRGRGQQRLTQHLLPPALPPGAHRARQAAVPACARAAPCEAATKADRGATARACLAPAREPLRSADGTPRGRRRKLVPSAARRAGPPAEKRAQPPAAREECGARQLASEHSSARRAAHPSLPRPLQPAPPPTAERVGRQQRAPPRLPRVPLPAPQGTCSLRARGAGLC